MAESSIEFLPSFEARPKITNVVFDFDGTVSILRQGWQYTMQRMFLEILPQREGSDHEALKTELFTEILGFNGKQPIHQMRAFAERVASEGQGALTGEEYLKDYAQRLRAEIDQRIERIRNGLAIDDEYVVHQARKVLDLMRAKGLRISLLSGTNEDFVREEAELLGLTDYFNAGIFGGTKDPTKFSKEAVYDRIMRDEGIAGENLLSIGDGPVEIRITKELKGLAVAVASDELDNGSGRVHPEKRQVLVDAGADVVIPDYRDAGELMQKIFQS